MSHELVPVIFAATYESLFNELKGRLDAEAENKLAQLGIDPRKLEPAYPHTVFYPSLRILAAAVYPKLHDDDAMYQLGRDYVLGMASTVVGSALYALARVVGPRRMLERMTRNARTSNNFTEAELNEAPDGSLFMLSGIRAELHGRMLDYDISPHYFRGIIHEALVQTGAKDPQVTLEAHDGAAFQTRYRITFSK